MKHALQLSVGVSLFLLSFALPRGELRFAVQEKTKLSKVFDGKVAFRSTSISLRVDGKDVESGMSGLKVRLDQSTHVELHDEYGALKSGRPAKLKRTFDKLEGKSAQHIDLPEGAPGKAPADANKSRSSELEGKTVGFTLGDEGEYKAA